ncbi:MAG: hypothetical protein IKP43_11540 [Bacteroidaceae bacterium]|jgi:hypothetical protein|nr:hypothetical protein [Bacteroidaceae bacterium]
MEKKTYITPNLRTVHLISSPMLNETTNLSQGQGDGGNVTETNQRNNNSNNQKDVDWGNLW